MTILQALPASFFVHVHMHDLPSYFWVTNPVNREEAKRPEQAALVHMGRRWPTTRVAGTLKSGATLWSNNDRRESQARGVPKHKFSHPPYTSEFVNSS